jgi:hypothetical protein
MTRCWNSRECFAWAQQEAEPVAALAPPAAPSTETAAGLACRTGVVRAKQPRRELAPQTKRKSSNRDENGQSERSQAANQQTWHPPEYWCLLLRTPAYVAEGAKLLSFHKIKGRFVSGLRGTFVVLKVSPVYLGGAVVVAGLVPVGGVAGLVAVPAGLLVIGRAGAATPDCAL